MAYDGSAGTPGAVIVELTADRHDAALCDTLGSCEHAFEIAIPMSLRDDAAHPVHVYAQSREDQFELEGSPIAITCPRPPLPAGGSTPRCGSWTAAIAGPSVMPT